MVGRMGRLLLCAGLAAILPAESIILSSDRGGRGVWTVVHPKQKASALLAQNPDAAVADPDAEKQQSIKDKIWDMGADMCKDKRDSPHCKKFQKDKEEPAAIEEPAKEEEEPETAAPTTPAPTEEVATTVAATPAPETTAAPTTAPAPATTAALTTIAATTEVATTVAPTEATADSTTAAAPATTLESLSTEERLREKHHVDGKTATSDWFDEYRVPATTTIGAADAARTGVPSSSKTAAKPAKSGAAVRHLSLLAFVPLVASLVH
mmetsp:Transcript_53333/g.152902  ORF Transcript_53333/g.152902 Transcript_53333/m.152902 type:complete len:266 (+) Transcript_53333:41-838(+)